MQIVFAYVYYFAITCAVLTVSLLVFAFHPCRKLLQKFQTKYQALLNNTVLKYIIYISFAIIFLILADSLRTYWAISRHFSLQQHKISMIGISNMDIMKSAGNENMIGILKEHREYYLAERNIMLTCSAMFIYFVMQRLFFSIRKLADEEHRIQNPMAQSVILQVVAELAIGNFMAQFVAGAAGAEGAAGLAGLAGLAESGNKNQKTKTA